MNEPVYCKDCKSQNSWERYPEKDLKYESGKIFELCYRCKECGVLTWERNTLEN